MRNFTILAVVLMLIGVQGGYAQQKRYSDYNLQKAIEMSQSDNTDEALSYVAKQLEEFPKDPSAYFVRARIYRSTGRYSWALSDLTKAIAYWNKECMVPLYSLYWWRGDIYYDELNECDKAMDDLDKAYKYAKKESESDALEIIMQKAHIHYVMGDYSAADKIYNKILKVDENELSAMIGIIRNMIARGEYSEAVELANRCEALDASYDEVYHFRMQAYDKLGERDKAIKDAILYYGYSDKPNVDEIESIVKKHLNYTIAKVSAKLSKEGDSDWRMLRILCYEWASDYAKALADYNVLEQEYGPSPNLYFYRAECYSYLGDMDSAIEDISVLIDRYDNASYHLYVTRADYYRLAGRYEEAIADMTKAIDIDPSIVYGYYKRGWCYELMRDDDSAMADYNLGIDIDINESYPYIYLMRGEQYLKRGDMESATADFEKVLELDTVADGGSCRQYALHLLGRDQEAIEWMDEVIALDPEDMGSYYDQACLYSRMGRAEEAISALRKALEKGYRSFAHIEFDDDLDAVRELSEFKALIEEYKGKIVYKKAVEDSVSDTIQTVSEVQMTRMRSGLYEVPCTINDLPLKFILDTGASAVTISSVEATFMLKNGYLTESDIKGKHYYSTASGEIREGTIICLREVKIGDAVLRNIEASVTHSQSAPLLLGQSVMERFGAITIDTATSMLTITQK